MTTTGPTHPLDLRAIPGHPGACPPGEGISSAAARGDFWPVLPPTLAGDRRQSHAPAKCVGGSNTEASGPAGAALNPCEDVAMPPLRRRDTDERIITRSDLRELLLPVVPDRYRALVATAAGTGLRWGEVIGLRPDAVNLDTPAVRVVRTVVEVSGNTSFKPYPKSMASVRTVPLPTWVVKALREHMQAFPVSDSGLIFRNEADSALRRTIFRARVWRPALVRAGLLGDVRAGDEPGFEAVWTDEDGVKHTERFRTHRQAVMQVARFQAGGLRFHDLRHSYGTWLEMTGCR
jgi:integrase